MTPSREVRSTGRRVCRKPDYGPLHLLCRIQNEPSMHDMCFTLVVRFLVLQTWHNKKICIADEKGRVLPNSFWSVTWATGQHTCQRYARVCSTRRFETSSLVHIMVSIKNILLTTTFDILLLKVLLQNLSYCQHRFRISCWFPIKHLFEQKKKQSRTI